MLDDREIESIAKEAGLDLYGSVRLVGDGDKLSFKRTPGMTFHGEKLMAFAKAIEREVTRRPASA